METIQIGQLGIKFLLSKHETKGSLDMFELTVPSAARVPMPHFHRDFDEAIYGLEGRLRLTVDGKAVDVGKGDRLFVPRGAVHHFINNGAETARTLTVLTPGLIGPDYFRDLAAIVNAGGPPDAKKVGAVMQRYGLVPAA